MQTKHKRAAFITATLVGLAGCNGYENVKREVDANHAIASKRSEEAHKAILTPKVSPLVTRSDRAWVASRAVPKELTEGLPAQFERVELHFGGRHNIAAVAEIISRTTGIPVMVHPDVFVPMTRLAPTTGGSMTPTTNGGASPSSVAAAPGNSAAVAVTSAQGTQMQQMTAQSGGDYFVDVPVDYTGSLRDFLDRITSRLGLDWEYRNGRVDIRRFITRTFTVMSMPGSSEFSSTLGKTGSQATGVTASATSGAGPANTQSGSFSSEASVKTKASIDYWASLEGNVKTMLSPVGRVAVNQGTGTVSITDTRDVVDRVSRMIEEENKALTRQVAIEVQVLSVRGNGGAEFGIDWDLVYSKLSSLAADWSLSVVSPGTLVNNIAGQVGLQILKTPTSDSGMARFNGSAAMIRALADVGRVATVTSQRSITLNRQSVPVAITDQTTYGAATTPGTATAGGTATFGITPGTVTTGFLLNLIPAITDRNSLILTMNVDISDLRDLTTFSSGSGANQQSIQTPSVSSTAFRQQVGLRTGETLVLSGFERVNNTYRQRGIGTDSSPGFGGSFTGSNVKESMVILITPVIIDGV